MPWCRASTDETVFLDRLFSVLNEEQVVYAVLGDCEVGVSRASNDIDIWIPAKHQKAFLEILRTTARGLGWDVIKPNVSPRLGRHGEGKYYLVKRDIPYPLVLHIDCWTFPHWRGIPYIDEETVVQHLVLGEGGFYTLPEDVRAGLSLLKYLLHTGEVNERHKGRIVQGLSHDSSSLLSILRKPLGDDTARLIIDLARKGRWDELSQRADYLRWTLFRRTLLYQPVRQLGYWLSYMWSAMLLYGTRYGVMLVLIGPDGSGKTTVAKALMHSEILDKLVERKYYFHTRFPFLPSLREIAHFLGFINADKAQHVGEPARKTEPLRPLICIVYPVYYGLGYLLGHLWVRRSKTRGGSLIIFDRYYYEYLIQPQFANCPKWLLGLLAKVVPKPDIIVYLKNTAEVIYSRKQELSAEEIARQLEVYERFVGDFRGRIATVITGTDVSCTVTEVERLLVGVLVEDSRA